MPQSISPAAHAILRAIARMEAENPGDPAIAELKRKALLRLAELQQRLKPRRSRVLVLNSASHQ